MIVAGSWVVPISRPPIRSGAVVVRDSVIVAVGSREGMVIDYPDDRVIDVGPCVITPGLVNAHTHLALTALRGVIPAEPFDRWLPQVARAIRAMGPDDLAISTRVGAHRCIASGTTVVGDIVYTPETIAIAEHAGLAGVHFWEILGTGADTVEAELSDAELSRTPLRGTLPRTRIGLSAHSPYTAGPTLIRAVHARARAHSLPFAIHLAESLAEVELIGAGTGPLRPIASRTAPDFAPTNTSPSVYVDRLGALSGALAIHCVHTDSDVDLLAARTSGVVLCPRSNAYVCAGSAPVSRLFDAGCTIALGTDSLASNENLDLFDEARALRGLAPGLTAERLLTMMTSGGAFALGLGEHLGTLEPGKQADLAAFAVGPVDDPYEALLRHGCGNRVEAVLSAGVWRVLGGQPAEPSHFANAALQRIAARLSMAIRQSQPPHTESA